MLKFIPPNVKRTLELGCGNGNFSGLIKNQYKSECWGVELNSQAATQAASRLDKVINADASSCMNDLPDNYFDCIIMNDFLEHLVDPYSILTGLKSKLNPQGVMVLSVPNVRYWENLAELVILGKWEYKQFGILDSTHLRFFTYKSLKKMFHDLGFEILTLKGMKHRRTVVGTIMQIFCLCFFNIFADIRFIQFACVIKPAG